LGVETKLRRLGVEIKRIIVEASSAGSTKLLIYRSRPAVVEMRFGLEIKFRRFCVETKLTKLGVETKFSRLGVETTPGTDER
jgi:hypothetical protein